MRIAHLIFAGSLAALVGTAAPALAKNSNTQTATAPKTEDTAASPGCRAYQQAPDGSWIQLPCQEPGVAPPAPAPHASATH
jgi:hypothetical protein